MVLASASGGAEDKMVYLWDAVTGEFIRGRSPGIQMRSIVWRSTRMSGVLASGSSDGTVLAVESR